MSDYNTQVKQAREALQAAGLDGLGGVKDWFSPSGDRLLEQGAITPFKVGIALLESWSASDPDDRLFHILTPLLGPREWSDVLQRSATVGPLWLFKQAWKKSDEQGRESALLYVTWVGSNDHFDWVLDQEWCAQQQYQDALVIAVTRGTVERVDRLLGLVDKPWTILPVVRKNTFAKKGLKVLDARWCHQLEQKIGKRPPARNVSSRFSADLPRVTSHLRAARLDNALAPASSPARKPRF